MKRLISILLCLFLLFAVPATAEQTNYQQQYDATIQQLNAYMQNIPGQQPNINEIVAAFQQLGNFGYAPALVTYSQILQFIMAHNIIGLEPNCRMLEYDASFAAYIDQLILAYPSLAPVSQIIAYGRGRTAEAISDFNTALEYYENCMYVMDVRSRYANCLFYVSSATPVPATVSFDLNVSMNSAGTRCNLSWTSVADAAYYNIYRITQRQGDSYKLINTVYNDTNYSDHTFISAMDNTYYIDAVDSYGNVIGKTAEIKIFASKGSIGTPNIVYTVKPNVPSPVNTPLSTPNPLPEDHSYPWNNQPKWSEWSEWSNGDYLSISSEREIEIEIREELKTVTAKEYSYSRWRYSEPDSNLIKYSSEELEAYPDGEWQYLTTSLPLERTADDKNTVYGNNWFDEKIVESTVQQTVYVPYYRLRYKYRDTAFDPCINYNVLINDVVVRIDETYSTEWSEWTTSPIPQADNRQIQMMVQVENIIPDSQFPVTVSSPKSTIPFPIIYYRYRDSYTDPIYSQKDIFWSAWSAWSTDAVSSSSTREVQTEIRTETVTKEVEVPVVTTKYTYNRFVYYNTTYNTYYYSYAEYNGPSRKEGSGKWEYKTTTSPLAKSKLVDGRQQYEGRWYNEQVKTETTTTKQTVTEAVAVTYYRYRDRLN